MLINSPNISGSLKVTGNSVITGSLTVLGGINGAITGSATTASYVEYSNVVNKPTLVSGSSQVTYSGLTGIPSGIVSGSAQIAGFGIFATTGSNQFNGSQAITGSLTVTGTIVAQTLNVQQVTSSVVFSSGSNVFGNSLANTQQFTGSVSMTGSLTTTTVQIAAAGSANPTIFRNVSGTTSSTSNTNVIGFNNVNNIFVSTQNSGGFILGFNNSVSNREYTLPDASGTVALTTNLGAYLPLTGGTLTGALRVENNAITQDGTRPILTLQQSGTAKVFLGISSGASDLVIGDASGDAVFRKPASSGAFRFSVDGGTSSAFVLASTGAATFSSSVTAQSMKIENTAAASFLYFNNTSSPASNYIALGSAANELYFQVNGSDRMIIKSDGKVGIGLTSPTGQLSIKNQISNGSNPVSSYAATSGVDGQNFFNGYYAENSDGLGPYPRYFDIVSTGSPDGSNGGSNIRFFTNPVANNSPAAERMRITSNGDIFMYGTTAQLRLNTSSNISIIQFWKDSTPTYANSIGNGVPGNSVTNDLVFSTYDTSINWNERMRITSGGNVGINNTSPTEGLVVSRGALRVTSQALDFAAGTRGISIDTTGGNLGRIYTVTGTGTATDLALGTNNTERMRITTGGNVSIGHIGDANQRLRVQGVDTGSSNYGLVVADSTTASTMYVRNDGAGYLKASAWSYGSDLRMKENISNVENGIEMVLKMKPKHFDYIDGQKNNLGFIAQDIQEIIPQAVSISDEKTGILALKTDFLVPYLVKAIQELKSENDTLKSRIDTLEQA